MKIKKAKRLLALIVCMALVLETNTFTMAADVSQSQEEISQEQEGGSQGPESEVQEDDPQETESGLQEDGSQGSEESGSQEDGLEKSGSQEVGSQGLESSSQAGMETRNFQPQSLEQTEISISGVGQESTQGETIGEGSQDANKNQENYNEWSAEQIYEYIQGLNDEEFNVLWESLSEEKQSEVQNYIEGLAPEEDNVDYNSLSVEEIYAALQEASNDETYFRIMDSLTDEKRQELDDYIKNTAQGITETVRDTRAIVNALMAAPVYEATERADNGFNTTGTDPVPGLQMSKELREYDSGSGKGTLNLEAFVTGDVYTSATPLDIVMVLDQSGSMSDSFGEATYIEKQYDNEEAYAHRHDLYVKVGDEYYQVQIKRPISYVDYVLPENTTYEELYSEFGKGGLYYKINGKDYELDINYSWRNGYTVSYDWRDTELVSNVAGSDIVAGDWINNLEIQQYSYEYSYRQNWQDIPLGTSAGANQIPPEGVVLYERGRKTALDSLMEAVSQFSTSVHNEAATTGVNHRIAITGFSSSGFNNTEILTVDNIRQDEPIVDRNDSYYPTGYAMNGIQYNGFGYDFAKGSALKDVTTQWDNIVNAINALTAHGGTQTADGLQMAVDIFNAYAKDYQDNDNPRQKVVILFTDGATNSDKNDVVRKAKALKDMGATVYTVGIFSGANGNITTDNWGKKKPESFIGSNKLMHLVSSNYPNASGYDKNNGSLADLEEGKTYFLSASDSNSLNEVFESIYDEVGGSSNEELDDKTVLYDEISEWFEVDSEDTDGIKVYRVPVATVTKNSDGTISYTWGEKVDITDEVGLDPNEKGISVTGFDYSENYVGTDNGTPRGYKLVLEIPIKDGDIPAFGGNNIPTNKENSGIYNASGETCYGNFSVPMVNKAVDYQIESQNKTVCITTSTSLGELLAYAENYQPDGDNNAFVDIKYQLYLDETLLGEFEIPAGKTASEGQWTWYNHDGISTSTGETGNMLNCTEYSLTCTVTPQEAISTTPTPAAVAKSCEPEIPVIHVVRPVISGQDQFIFLGEKVEFGENVTWTVDEWTDMNNAHTNIPPVPENKPTLTITPVYAAGTTFADANNYYPEEDSDFTINVKIGNTDITEYCNIKPDTETDHKDCILNEENVNHHFTIHVVGGAIKLYKQINGDMNSSTEGDAIFTFRVTYKPDQGSEASEVRYYTVEFKNNNGGDPTLVADLDNLKKGIYTIEELKTQRYDSTTISAEGSTNGIVSIEETSKMATVTIGGTTAANGKQTGVITYTNIKNTDSGSMTDTDVIVNKFTYSDEGYTFTQKNPVQVEGKSTIGQAADFIAEIFN